MSMQQVKKEKRVISFFIWDPELERKIDCEVKVIDGISKLLHVATTADQVIECNKALVLSQQRMLEFMSEIRRKQQNLLKLDDHNLAPTKATVILTDIRLPLAWAKMKKVKADQKKFAVFCLARIGCEIIDTKMKFIDKQSRDIIFTDTLIFENVPHNFQLHLDVYALNQSFALSTTTRDFADRYSYFAVHGSPKGRRKATVDEKPKEKEQKASDKPQSKFVLIARATYTKESVHKMAKIRPLTLERSFEDPLMQLPIEAVFLSRFLIHPLCYTPSAKFGGIVENRRIAYSCTIMGGFLHGEEVMTYNHSEQRTFSIPITSDTMILSRDDKLSFSVYNRGFNQEDFFVHDLFTLNLWIRALQQHIVDMRAWERVTEHIPPTRRYSYQPMIKSNSTVNLAKQSTLKTKSRSLDNIHHTNLTYEPLQNTRFNQHKNAQYTSGGFSPTKDEDDNTEFRLQNRF